MNSLSRKKEGNRKDCIFPLKNQNIEKHLYCELWKWKPESIVEQRWALLIQFQFSDSYQTKKKLSEYQTKISIGLATLGCPALIERLIIEDQAFSPSYDLAPIPTPPLPLSTGDTQENWERKTTCRRDKGEKRVGGGAYDGEKACMVINKSFNTLWWQLSSCLWPRCRVVTGKTWDLRKIFNF